MSDAKSLSHTKERAIREILRKLCEWKGPTIREVECCPDHIHMLLEIPPMMSGSSFMGYLKGKSSLMIYEHFGELNSNTAIANIVTVGTMQIR